MFSRIHLVFFAVSFLSASASIVENKNDQTKSDNKSRDCTNSYSTTCLKLDLVSWLDKLSEEERYSVVPGVSVIRENDTARINTADIVAELAREFPNDPDARLDAFLMKRVESYLNSHSLHFDISGRSLVESARRGGGGGGGGVLGGGSSGGGGGGNKGGGGGGGMGTMLLAGAMMKGTMLALALGGIAAIAGKALMAGLISLMLSAIIGIKSLTQGKQTTYEVVSKPVFTHSSSHSVSHEPEHHPGYGHSSYGRSFDQPLPLSLHPDYKPQ